MRETEMRKKNPDILKLSDAADSSIFNRNVQSSNTYPNTKRIAGYHGFLHHKEDEDFVIKS